MAGKAEEMEVVDRRLRSETKSSFLKFYFGRGSDRDF